MSVIYNALTHSVGSNAELVPNMRDGQMMKKQGSCGTGLYYSEHVYI